MLKKITFKPFLLALAVVLSLVSCKKESSSTSTKENIKVFRSVLDKIPRMATAALDDNMWVAYNTQNATLYKAWKGGVNFDGAVYTTKHGPQPTSLGYAYYSHNEAWVLLKNGSEISPSIQYKGHRFENGHPTFKFELKTPEDQTITINETPNYKVKGNKNGLERLFEASNDTDYEVALKTVISSLESEDDFSTNGKFFKKNEVTIDFDSGQVTEIEGFLILNNGETTLTTYFHPGFDQIDKNNNELALAESSKKLPPGAKLINNSDCIACHNETVKTVGPSYLSIAEKYPNNDATVNQLSEKIKLGGQGVWGEVPMTPHPDLLDADINEMVRYILSLNKNEPKEEKKPTHPEKYSLNIPSSPLKFEDDVAPASGTGFVANLFLTNLETRESNFSKTALTDKIHVLDAPGFGKEETNIKIVFRSQITIDKEDSYDFRLISDDGSYLFIDDQMIIDNGGNHAFKAVDGEMYLKKGTHELRVEFEQGGGQAALSFQWFNKKTKAFELVPTEKLHFNKTHFTKTKPYKPVVEEKKIVGMPGDQIPLNSVHPSFSIYQARPDDFKPKVGGMDFLDDDTIALSTWDPDGSVYLIKNYKAENPEDITVKRIAKGLAEPLGLKVVDGAIYVLQKQELTKLIDHDGDELIDEYETVSNGWKVSANFHEFAFGLIYKDGHFYATLATAILPGGASANPQIPDRGKVVKISIEDGSTEFEAIGLRTPNGIGFNVDKEIFVADNQGDWLPSSKIVHIQKGEFYGSHSVDPIGTKDLKEKLPVVWLPQDEIGNSPSTPTYLNIGPYKDQLIHGEVTHGGIKRVAYEKVEGQLQGALFRFTQGIESGVNRICWAPDGSLLVGGIGVSGNWQHYGKLPYGLQRLKYNGNSTFEMLKINAKPDGFDIVFTEPISGDHNLTTEDINIEQWYYKPTIDYGGPKLGLETLNIEKISLSEDRKTVSLTIPNLKENHVVYFHLNKDLKSTSDKNIWSTEAWYTLNRIPK